MITGRPYAFDVGELAQELTRHPEAWDQYRWRTEHPRSPHREVSDIWVRYNSLANFGPHFNDPHDAIWYPIADDLPSARRIANAVADIEGASLAGVLITKIPARKQVYPHVDRGWHAENTEKVGVLVHGNSAQRFCFEGIEHTCEPGGCFSFVNQFPHWVLNDTDEDRVTLIVCLRKH